MSLAAMYRFWTAVQTFGQIWRIGAAGRDGQRYTWLELEISEEIAHQLVVDWHQPQLCARVLTTLPEKDLTAP